MLWPGLQRQRGVHPAPNLGDPRCFPHVQSSGRCHRAHSWGCGAPGGVITGYRSDSSQQPACLSWRARCPCLGCQESWSRGLSARGVSPGAPVCQGPVLHGDGDHDSHVVLLCVRSPNWPHCFAGQEWARVPLLSCTAGARAPRCRAAQPLVQWGFWSGAARQADGQLERLVQRRCWDWEEKAVGGAALSHGALCTARFPPGHHRLSLNPLALGCSKGQSTEPACFPSPALPFSLQHHLLYHGAGAGSHRAIGKVRLLGAGAGWDPGVGTSCSAPDPRLCGKV